LYYRGKNHDDKNLQVTGLALGQAALLGFTVSSGIKAFTGRHAPDIIDNSLVNNNRKETDFSGDFKFGFMERGVFDGWPSSHTATAFAMASALATMYPDNKSVAIWAYSYATFVGLGMSVMAHWASDIVAGALIGVAIGKTVGKSYRNFFENGEDKKNNLSWFVTPNSVSLVYQF